MKKKYLPLTLMIAAIIGISSFQSFWLRQTYLQEKKTLSIKTDFAFSNTMQHLQVLKLKLDKMPGDTSGVKVKMLVNDSLSQRITVQLDDKNGMLSTINVIRKKFGGLPPADSLGKKQIFISSNHTLDRNIEEEYSIGDRVQPRDQIIKLLYGVDSLQDSLKIADIKDLLNKHLQKQKIELPYHIERIEGRPSAAVKNYPEVTVGFAHPITYRMVTENSLPYLLRQISMPIIFSILLLALTILSFLMLYRNLLKQRKLTQIKNEFIANITHELKTPIATVSVAIEAMKNFNALHDPARTGEYLGIAGLELNRLSMLVDKVLKLSMFENKAVELKYEKFDFKVLLQDVISTMHLQFEKANAKINTEWEGEGFAVDADRVHISSVLYNLLDNAIRYSNEHPDINIKTFATQDAILCSIADKGIGIDPMYRHKIFEKFFRVPQGDIHNVKGYGLGLSYAAHIMEQHKGTIECTSDGKNGTEFIIKLPLQHAS